MYEFAKSPWPAFQKTSHAHLTYSLKEIDPTPCHTMHLYSKGVPEQRVEILLMDFFNFRLGFFSIFRGTRTEGGKEGRKEGRNEDKGRKEHRENKEKHRKNTGKAWEQHRKSMGKT
jgi:hypothetical protein